VSPSSGTQPNQIAVLVAVGLTTVILYEIGINYFSAWNTIVAFALGWVIADFVISRTADWIEVKIVIVGLDGKRHYVPPIATEYLIYFGSIVFATLASEWTTPYLLQALQSSSNALPTYIAITSLISGLLVFLDLDLLHTRRLRPRQTRSQE
jgi:hypothetical protein